MAAPDSSSPSSTWQQRLPRFVALAVGGILVALGLWAIVDPRSFFDAVVTFEPYNQHFLQDIGAFQVGLGAVLLLATMKATTDGLAIALLGVGIGLTFHALSHMIGHDLGGTPEVGIPVFTALAGLLLGAGAVRWRHVSGS
ncbi:MAG TPA: hypothetical protein VMM78_02485 [Thermomicrobiales bacterium]|nr:hypothetical protein [Thermomicrobiales bacterium]